MSFDGEIEVQAILERAASLAGGRVYEGVADSEVIPTDASRLCKPHIVLSFGQPYPVFNRGRGLGTDETQPHLMPVSFDCVGASAAEARALAAGVSRRFTGWSAGDNADQLRVRAGSEFVERDAARKPSRWHRTVFAAVPINLAA